MIRVIAGNSGCALVDMRCAVTFDAPFGVLPRRVLLSWIRRIGNLAVRRSGSLDRCRREPRDMPLQYLLLHASVRDRHRSRKPRPERIEPRLRVPGDCSGVRRAQAQSSRTRLVGVRRRCMQGVFDLLHFGCLLSSVRFVVGGWCVAPAVFLPGSGGCTPLPRHRGGDRSVLRHRRARQLE